MSTDAHPLPHHYNIYSPSHNSLYSPRTDVDHIPSAPPHSTDWPYPLDVHVYPPTTPVPFPAFHPPVEPSSQSYALAGALQSSPKLTTPARADLARRPHSSSTALPMSATSPPGQSRWAYTASPYGHDDLSVSRMAINDSGSRPPPHHHHHHHQQQQQHPHPHPHPHSRAYLAASSSASSGSEQIGVDALGDSHSHSHSHPHSHPHLAVEGGQMSHGGVALGEAMSAGVPIGAEFGGGGMPQGASSSTRGQGFPHPHSQNHQAMLIHQAQDAYFPQQQQQQQSAGHARPGASPQPNSGEPLSNIVSPLPRQPTMALSSGSHPAFSLSPNYALSDPSHSHSRSPAASGGLGIVLPTGNGSTGNSRTSNGTHSGGVGGGGEAELDADGDEEYDLFDEDEFEEESAEEAEGSRRSYPHSSPTPELQYPPGTSGTPADFLRSDAASGSMLFPYHNGSGGGASPGGLSAQNTARPQPSFSPKGRGPPGRSAASYNNDMLDQAHFDPASSVLPPAPPRGSPHDKGKRVQSAAAAADTEPDSGHQTVKVLMPSSTPGEPPKKVKMHQCRICQKLFPRPSGLATHMNSHSGARPYKCPLQLCNKTFAVRSNARRHLRTHGISAPPASLDKVGQGRNQPQQPFRVGFDTPVVVDVHDFGRTYVDSGGPAGTTTTTTSAEGGAGGGSGSSSSGKAQRLRWVPQSLATRTNAGRLRSLSPSASDMADLDLDADYDDDEGFEVHQKATSPSDGRASSNRSSGRRSHLSPGSSSSHSGGGHSSPLFSRRAPDLKIAPVPLPPSMPTDPSSNVYAKYDERNSFSEAGTFPYHPDQWRCMPGPG